MSESARLPRAPQRAVSVLTGRVVLCDGGLRDKLQPSNPGPHPRRTLSSKSDAMRDARTQSHPRWAPGLAAAALATLAVPAAAQVRQSPASWPDALAAYVAPLIQMNDFSGTILILREGHDSIVAGFGFADRARGIANGPGTRFGIGSLTKTFTAARSPSGLSSPTRRGSRTTTLSPTTAPGARNRLRWRSSPRGSARSPSIFVPGRKTPTRARDMRSSPL